MRTRKRNNYILNIIFIIIILAASTFLCGFFIPRQYIENYSNIISILLAIFGVAITLFTFLQGVVQSSKTNLLHSNREKSYKEDKLLKLDNIVNELMSDLKWMLFSILIYIIIVFFFLQIENSIFQEILCYIQYLLFSIIVLTTLDLIFTMFKLVKINSLLNNMLIDNEQGETKDGE